jgi:hypothetical protein
MMSTVSFSQSIVNIVLLTSQSHISVSFLVLDVVLYSNQISLFWNHNFNIEDCLRPGTDARCSRKLFHSKITAINSILLRHNLCFFELNSTRVITQNMRKFTNHHFVWGTLKKTLTNSKIAEWFPYLTSVEGAQLLNRNYDIMSMGQIDHHRL